MKDSPPNGTGKPDEAELGLDDFAKNLWDTLERLRVASGLRFDEYGKTVLGLTLLGFVNQQVSMDGRFRDKTMLPDHARWDHLLTQSESTIGDAINSAMSGIASENTWLNVAITADYNRTENRALIELVRIFADVTKKATDNTFGALYEIFLDRFANAAGQRSGEFSTPREIASLLASVLKPQGGMSVYDPCFGTGGFLLEVSRYATGSSTDLKLKLFGQDINRETLSLGQMHLAVNGIFDASLGLGNTLTSPYHTGDGRLLQFDRVIANPPFSAEFRGIDFAEDPFEQFPYGTPPSRNANFAFIQHMLSSLRPDGRMATVVPHNVLFCGGREGDIRQAILKDDLVEAVIGLPSNLFYGTSIAAAILVCNKAKASNRAGKVLFINADRDFERSQQRNTLRPEHVERIINVFDSFSEIERFSRVSSIEEIAANNFNLHIPRYADSSPLAGLVTHYDNFAKFTIKDLAVEINSANHGTTFENKKNAIYVPISGKSPTENIEALEGKHQGHFQVVFNEKARGGYVVQFLSSSVGQHALSIMAVGTISQKLRKADLQECIVALPDLETQDEIIATHGKINRLKAAIDEFDRELSINPVGLGEFRSQLDSMLTVIGGLTDADFIRGVIRQGESKTVEFKQTFSLNVHHDSGQRDSKIELSSLKTVVAFLNSDGGDLLIGVSDDEKITGVEGEIEKFHNNVADKFLLHFKNALKRSVGEQFYPFIKYRIIEVEGKKVLAVKCKASECPCFLDDKAFYVRTNPATDLLEGGKQYEYIKHRFGL